MHGSLLLPSNLELELEASIDVILAVEEVEGEAVVANRSEAGDEVFVGELNGVPRIVAAGELDHLLVQEHSIEFYIYFHSLKPDGFLGCPSLYSINFTTSISSLMFLLGVWSRVTVSMFQSASPHRVKGHGIPPTCSTSCCYCVCRVKQNDDTIRTENKNIVICVINTK